LSDARISETARHQARILYVDQLEAPAPSSAWLFLKKVRQMEMKKK
jgi:hypothetical protein